MGFFKGKKHKSQLLQDDGDSSDSSASDVDGSQPPRPDDAASPTAATASSAPAAASALDDDAAAGYGSSASGAAGTSSPKLTAVGSAAAREELEGAGASYDSDGEDEVRSEPKSTPSTFKASSFFKFKKDKGDKDKDKEKDKEKEKEKEKEREKSCERDLEAIVASAADSAAAATVAPASGSDPDSPRKGSAKKEKKEKKDKKKKGGFLGLGIGKSRDKTAAAAAAAAAAEEEEEAAGSGGAMSPVLSHAEPEKLERLMDMGFSQGRAAEALSRAGGDAKAAVDLLVTGDVGSDYDGDEADEAEGVAPAAAPARHQHAAGAADVVSIVRMASSTQLVTDLPDGAIGLWEVAAAAAASSAPLPVVERLALPGGTGDEVSAVCTEGSPKATYVGTSKGRVFALADAQAAAAATPPPTQVFGAPSEAGGVVCVHPTPDHTNLFVSCANGVVYVTQPDNPSRSAPHQVPLPAKADLPPGTPRPKENRPPVYESMAYNPQHSEFYAACGGTGYVVRVRGGAAGGAKPVSTVPLPSPAVGARVTKVCCGTGAAASLFAADDAGGLYARACGGCDDAPVRHVSTTLPSVEHLAATPRHLIAASTKEVHVFDADTLALLKTLDRPNPDSFLTGVCVDPTGTTLAAVSEGSGGAPHVFVTVLDAATGFTPAAAAAAAAAAPAIVGGGVTPLAASPQPPSRNSSFHTDALSEGASPTLRGTPGAKPHKTQASLDFEDFFGAAAASSSLSPPPPRSSAGDPPATPPQGPASATVRAAAQLQTPIVAPASQASTPTSTPSSTPKAAPQRPPCNPPPAAAFAASPASATAAAHGGVNGQLVEAFNLLGGLPALEQLAGLQTHPQEKARLQGLASSLKGSLLPTFSA